MACTRSGFDAVCTIMFQVGLLGSVVLTTGGLLLSLVVQERWLRVVGLSESNLYSNVVFFPT